MQRLNYNSVNEPGQPSTDDFWRGFCRAIATDGRLVFPPLPDEHPSPPSNALLLRLECQHRPSFPGTAPDFDPKATSWAALTLFTATRLIAERHREPTELVTWLADDLAPAQDTPSVIYSVDLFLSCLPDLVSLASQRSADDPLLGVLRALAKRFPFSGLGISDLIPDDHLDSPALTDRRFLPAFADRVIARRAWPWLAVPAVGAHAAETIGAHPAHFPDLHTQLSQHES